MPCSETHPRPRHIVLVGSMAAGKSSVARALARRLGRPVLDNDEQLAASRGVTGRETAVHNGVVALHQAEAQLLLEALATTEPGVIAAAASVVDADRCLAALKDADVVWLRIRPETAARRMGEPLHRRSLGHDAIRTLAALGAQRAPRYREVADLAIDVDELTVPEVVDRVLVWMNQPSSQCDDSRSDEHPRW
jgi:shikimate kinase